VLPARPAVASAGTAPPAAEPRPSSTPQNRIRIDEIRDQKRDNANQQKTYDLTTAKKKGALDHALGGEFKEAEKALGSLHAGQSHRHPGPDRTGPRMAELPHTWGSEPLARRESRQSLCGATSVVVLDVGPLDQRCRCGRQSAWVGGLAAAERLGRSRRLKGKDLNRIDRAPRHGARSALDEVLDERPGLAS
jgi:hypothetical protein